MVNIHGSHISIVLILAALTFVLLSETNARQLNVVPDQNFSLIQLPAKYKARRHMDRVHLQKGDCLIFFPV